MNKSVGVTQFLKRFHICRTKEHKLSEKFSIAVTINAPIEEVWRKLVDWKSQSSWMAMTRVEASHRGAEDSGVGTTIDAFTGFGKLGILDRMRVTQWNPPRFCAVDHYGRIIKGIGEFRLEEIVQTNSRQTRFHWFEEINGPRAILILVKPGILAAVYLSLRKFSRWVERR